MRNGRFSIAVTLALFGSSALLGARGGAPPLDIRTADEAIEQLPPIGQDARWTGKEWVVHPAAAWLTEYLAKGGPLTDEQWRRALSKSRAIRVRQRWPVDEPFAIGMEVPRWLPLTEIRLSSEISALSSARAGSLVPSRCGNCTDSARRRARYQVLGMLASSEPQVLRYQVVVERGPPPKSFYARRSDPPPEGPPAGVLWTGSVEFTVELVPELVNVVPAFQDEELDAEIHKLLVETLWEDHLLLVGVDFEAAPRVSNTALSFELTLFEGQEERGTKTFLALANPGLINQGVNWDLPAPLADPSLWSIRVRGRPTEVLHDWDALRYWDGEITISLANVQRR